MSSSTFHKPSRSCLSRRAAPIKRTAVEKQVNLQIVFLFGLLLALSLGSTIGSSIRAVSQLPLLYEAR